MSSPSSVFESCRAGGQSFIELMGCSKSETPVTEESLKKEFYIVMTAGAISCALLLIGLIGQLGLFPMGNGAASTCTFLGGAGLLLTAYTGYRYWKKVQAFEKEKEQARLTQQAAAASDTLLAAGTSFLSDRVSSLRNLLPSFWGETPTDPQ